MGEPSGGESMNKITYSLDIVLTQTGFDKNEIFDFMDHEIIVPFDSVSLIFDDEDLSRLRLLRDLKDNCDTNLDSYKVILHLVDQIHFLQNKSKEQ
jgi:hypothetical protein